MCQQKRREGWLKSERMVIWVKTDVRSRYARNRELFTGRP